MIDSVTPPHSRMFLHARAFNSNISQWDVGAVTDSAYVVCCLMLARIVIDKDISFRYMFYDARAFNSDISQWNVGQVTNM